ncbi:hypothetical protein Nmel_002321 [Mimus melanotis]
MMPVLPVSVVISAPSCFAPEEGGHKKVRSHLRAPPPRYMVLASSLPRCLSEGGRRGGAGDDGPAEPRGGLGEMSWACAATKLLPGHFTAALLHKHFPLSLSVPPLWLSCPICLQVNLFKRVYFDYQLGFMAKRATILTRSPEAPEKAGGLEGNYRLGAPFRYFPGLPEDQEGSSKIRDIT